MRTKRVQKIRACHMVKASSERRQNESETDRRMRNIQEMEAQGIECGCCCHEHTFANCEARKFGECRSGLEYGESEEREEDYLLNLFGERFGYDTLSFDRSIYDRTQEEIHGIDVEEWMQARWKENRERGPLPLDATDELEAFRELRGMSVFRFYWPTWCDLPMDE